MTDGSVSAIRCGLRFREAVAHVAEHQHERHPADCEAYWAIADHNEKCAIVVEKAARFIAGFLLDNDPDWKEN